MICRWQIDQPVQNSVFLCLYRSVESIIKQMCSHQLPECQLSEDATICIQVRRKKIWKDTLRAFKQPRFTAHKWLKVEFIGEAVIDDGGPRREFFWWGMQELSNNNALFQGPRKARLPTHNVHLLCNKEYREVGMFFALSILQGGPAPQFCCQPLHTTSCMEVTAYRHKHAIFQTWIFKPKCIRYID